MNVAHNARLNGTSSYKSFSSLNVLFLKFNNFTHTELSIYTVDYINDQLLVHRCVDYVPPCTYVCKQSKIQCDDYT